MTRQTKGLLYYLARYLEQHEARRPRLIALCQKLTGKPLHIKTLWRHVKLHKAPSMDLTLVYLTFLYREKTIVPSGNAKDFFLYAEPELLKMRPKKN